MVQTFRDPLDAGYRPAMGRLYGTDLVSGDDIPSIVHFDCRRIMRGAASYPPMDQLDAQSAGRYCHPADCFKQLFYIFP
ncbi:hypothetical protein D3C77_289840 [compost metagenome]